MPITRQEGDTSKIRVTVPDAITLSGRTIHFEVRDRARNIVFEKSGADWTVTGQIAEADVSEADTKGKRGKHRYEMQVWDSNVVLTILKGTFTVEAELIKESRHG